MTKNNQLTRLAAAAFIGAGLSLAVSMPAQADPSLNCIGYATKAMNQINKANTNNCGFTGPRWRPGFNAHVIFCLLPTTKQFHLDSERQARKAQINQCTGGGGNKVNYCNDYAQDAVNAQKKNVQNGCGFGGGRWTMNFGAHQNWCMNVPKAKSKGETKARKQQLNQCVGGGGNKAQYCNNYAQSAVNQQKKNLQKNCGLAGGRWHLNKNQHKNWCMSAPKANSLSEFNKRKAKLAQCGGGAGNKAQFCNSYSQKAVNQQQKNLQKNCGLSGGRWHLNYNKHNNWCMGAPKSKANSEHKIRKNKLNQCGAGAGNKAQFCSNYAQSAVNQQQNNLQKNCGLSGNRWHLDYNKHNNWCMSAPKVKATSEHKTRKNKLNQCGAGAGNKAQFCSNYAQSAVNQQQNNLQKNCGFAGGRWNLNYIKHRDWCMNTPKANATGERSARKAQLNQCGGGAANSAQFCDNYAQTAINQQSVNLQKNCGNKGNRWHMNFAKHRDWCMSANKPKAQFERNARVQKLAQCP